LFEGLDLRVERGEFVAVLGPNGAGKTSLLKVLLGLIALSAGEALVCGTEPQRARDRVGYIPQQRAFDRQLPIRGRDFVHFGLDGNRLGLARTGRRTRAAVDRVLDDVNARPFADEPLGRLSGGEQQRLRVAQALLTNPAVLLCDEPLLSLDAIHQHTVCELLDQRRREAASAIVFVTHEITPVLPYAERVLYLAGGQWTAGSPGEVLTSAQLTRLHGSPVEVVKVGDEMVIVGTDTSAHHLEAPANGRPVHGSADR
jgi:zinc/manganese transport system ATP-binding protein